jgi:hypothetical protein
MFKTLNRAKLITQTPWRALRTGHKREANWQFENERKAFEKLVSEQRKVHKADYWDNQT